MTWISLMLLIAAPGDDLPECNEQAAEMGVQQEMNICAHRDYLIADAALNAQWRLTRQTMQERDSEAEKPDWDERPGYFDTLLEAQRAWIAYRDAHCRSEGYSARGGSLEPLLVSTCKIHLTELRTAQLRELAETY
ncbi:lysozyme inhibitor LprI family protein [Erythrobacter aurantius]|uniref:lysozyme inhibitor LprI family protein n=1 Tax=Erythrobacter aurantius TaxID=2909249 RepID=UPI0020793672|nr:lysozyme inhibitor LprI family protein [Erythrobacter aurantius]